MKITPWAWATWVMARSVRWRGTRHSPAPTRVTVRRRVTAVGTTRIESAYVSAARARPAGVCAWRWRWRPRRLPDRGLYDASFFSSAHSHDSHCRAAHSRFGTRATASATRARDRGSVAGGAGTPAPLRVSGARGAPASRVAGGGRAGGAALRAAVRPCRTWPGREVARVNACESGERSRTYGSVLLTCILLGAVCLF